MKKIKLYLSILNQGNIRPELSMLLLKIAKESKFLIYLDYSSLKPIANNRNTIVQNFLKTDYTHLMMIDSDIVPSKNPIDLCSLDKDVIGLPCPVYQKKNGLFWNIFNKKKNEYKIIKEQKGLFEVDAVGSGAIIIKREVLEEIQKPFERKWDKYGREILGLDLYFCEKAKKNNKKIFTHMDFKCSHWVTFDLLSII